MLLLVVLDYLGSTYFRLLRVIPKFAQRPALAQEIPVLVQLDFQLAQATSVIVCQFAPPIQAFLLLHQAINVIEYRLILFLDGHRSSFLMTARIALAPEGRGPAAQSRRTRVRCTHPIVKAKKYPRSRFSPNAVVKVSLKQEGSVTNAVIRPDRPHGN